MYLKPTVNEALLKLRYVDLRFWGLAPFQRQHGAFLAGNTELPHNYLYSINSAQTHEVMFAASAAD